MFGGDKACEGRAVSDAGDTHPKDASGLAQAAARDTNYPIKY
jgi:hypothetical protein